MLAVICLLSAPSCRGSECVVMGRKVVGGTASILCSYKPEQKDFKKYFSKGTGEGKVGLLHHQKPSSNGRYKLHDDTEKGRFTVTMADLTPEDSGTYRCGVGQGEEIQVSLTVERAPSITVYNMSVILILTLSLSLVLLISFSLVMFCKSRISRVEEPPGAQTCIKPSTSIWNVPYANAAVFDNTSVFQSLSSEAVDQDHDYQIVDTAVYGEDSLYQVLDVNPEKTASIYQVLDVNPEKTASIYQVLDVNPESSDSL